MPFLFETLDAYKLTLKFHNEIVKLCVSKIFRIFSAMTIPFGSGKSGIGWDFSARTRI